MKPVICQLDMDIYLTFEKKAMNGMKYLYHPRDSQGTIYNNSVDSCKIVRGNDSCIRPSQLCWIKLKNS